MLTITEVTEKLKQKSAQLKLDRKKIVKFIKENITPSKGGWISSSRVSGWGSFYRGYGEERHMEGIYTSNKISGRCRSKLLVGYTFYIVKERDTFDYEAPKKIAQFCEEQNIAYKIDKKDITIGVRYIL